MMRDEAAFVIAGAGVLGLSAALAIHQRGHKVWILEAGKLDHEFNADSSRVYALNQASIALLARLGVWKQLAAAAAPYERMQVWDAHSDASIDFDARMLAQDRLGVILPEPDLKQALMQQITKQNIPIVTQWQTQTIETLENTIILTSNQQRCEAGFLVIADGARSPTRALLSIPMTTWAYDQQALVATVGVEKSHNRTAYQVFCPQGPLAFLPMADPHRCAIVWSSAVPHIETLLASSEQSFLAALGQAFEYKLGQLELLSPRKYYPLRMQHVQHYVGPHWAIMGDAAHTIHPLAGLGLNLGLADLTAFLAILDHGSASGLSLRALRGYQRQRKYELWQTILFLQGIHTLFTSSMLPAKLVRRVGLNLCNHLPLLKRLCMEQATGLPRT